MRTFVLCLWLGFLCSACSNGGSDNSPGTTPTPGVTPTPSMAPSVTPIPSVTPTPSSSPTPTPTISGQTISGRITFDRVPHTAVGSLDYADTQILPARNVQVVLLDSADRVLATAVTDSDGNYQLETPSETNVRVAVDAVMARADDYQWHFEVVDNTSNGALYSIAGPIEASGSDNSVRNLHAPSGWNLGIDDYNDITQRPAAPFAILDAIYEATDALVQALPGFTMPDCTLNWSYRNNTVQGQNENGDLGTTYYDPAQKAIFILGDADGDTDEYDYSVLQHEFMHFVEDVLSRSDSIGGGHSLISKLDMRVAFSEGLANGFAAILNGAGIYSDSQGVGQQDGYAISFEENSLTVAGWYSENSIAKILYDLYDETNESGDTLSLGIAPIIDAIADSAFTENSAFASIYLFANALNGQVSGVQTPLASMLAREQVFGTGVYGVGETNNGSVSTVLPIYLALGGSPVTACSSNKLGEYNALGTTRYLQFSLQQRQLRQIILTRQSGPTSTDPDAYLYKNGVLVQSLVSPSENLESASLTLEPGDYVLEINDYNNMDEDPLTGGNSCFQVRLL
nr:hypothetical protein [Teredinibacter turnerae]